MQVQLPLYSFEFKKLIYGKGRKDVGIGCTLEKEWVEASGFCEQHPGLKVSTLSYWIGKFNKMNKSSEFIELSGVSSSAELRLIYPNGVQLCTSSSDLHLIGHLIRIY